MKNAVLFIAICVLLSSRVYSQSCNCFVKVDSTYNLVPMSLGLDTGGAPNYRCNDCSGLPIKLPFTFCFYGKNYDTVYVNNKGNLTFTNPDFTFSNAGLPIANIPMLAPFYADIDDRPFNAATAGSDAAAIYYKTTATHLIVQWNLAGYSALDDDLYNDFQVTLTNGSDTILPSGNNVAFCYGLMQWASGDSSGGSGGFNGVPATIGVNKGDGINYAEFGAFDFPGYSYLGPLDTAGQLYWLNNKSLIFNTCISGNTIPPVIINPNLCDTMSICAGDTASFSYSFLCSQIGQTAAISVTSPGLSGITTNTSVSNSIYSSTSQLIASVKDTGAHLITVQATDNNTPALINNITLKLLIKSCDSTLGINEIKTNNNFSVYPNPGDGKYTIKVYNSNMYDNATFKVFDMLGNNIYSGVLTGNKTELDISSQPKGIYFIKLFSKEGFIDVEKLVVQ